jgi:hypothetical protein
MSEKTILSLITFALSTTLFVVSSYMNTKFMFNYFTVIAFFGMFVSLMLYIDSVIDRKKNTKKFGRLK